MLSESYEEEIIFEYDDIILLENIYIITLIMYSLGPGNSTNKYI